MDPVGRALWYIESHFAEEITLDAVARVAGLSRFPISRAFVAATGRPVMRYVRARRLSEAAKALTDGSADILGVALDAGYGSHEAFTRAFRDQFGMTPEQVRKTRCLDRIALVEAIRMENVRPVALEEPRFETRPGFVVAGLSEHFTEDTQQRIPVLWQRFSPYVDVLSRGDDDVAYGVCTDITDDGAFDYMAAVGVERTDELPPEVVSLQIPEQHYAVFTHKDHVAAIKSTMRAIWSTWLPQSGYKAARGPEFERYDARFDPRTGEGGFEIWVPIER